MCKKGINTFVRGPNGELQHFNEFGRCFNQTISFCKNAKDIEPFLVKNRFGYYETEISLSEILKDYD